MSTMTETTASPELLHVSTVDVKPSNIDWSAGSEYGESEHDYWEALDYEDGDESWTLIASSGSVVAVVIDGQTFDNYGDYADLVIEPVLNEGQFDELMSVEPYQWGSEGPMMNYWYSIEEDADRYSSFDPIAAAVAVADLPVCIVEVDGAYGLALTGGGMDLSWEICAAFIALGKLPPVHFAHLPKFAESWTERKETVVTAMRRSLDVQVRWLLREVDHLDTLHP